MAENIVLTGTLKFIGFGDLLQQLGSSGATGIITLTSPYADAPGKIYIKDGNPIHAEYKNLSGIDALNSFFGWDEAEFSFSEEPVTVNKTIKKSRMELILDGLRMLDDGIIPKLGPGTSPAADKKAKKGDSELPVINGPVIDYIYVVDEEEFKDGQEIVVQDKFGNWFWVILSGTVEVMRETPEGRIPIVRLSEGAFIGSFVSFLREGNIRSATVVAVGDVQLGILDSELISREYSNLSNDAQKILLSMDRRLRQVTDVCVKVLAGQNVVESDTSGLKRLIGPDENEEEVFRITKGNAYVIRETGRGFIRLCSMREGDFIGQIPSVNTAHEPYSAIVMVDSDYEGESYDTASFIEEYESLSKTFKNMIQNMATGISVTTGRIMDMASAKLKEKAEA